MWCLYLEATGSVRQLGWEGRGVGGRALKQIQSEQGKVVGQKWHFLPPGNQKARTLLCCVPPTHNGNLTDGVVFSLFPSLFLYSTIVQPCFRLPPPPPPSSLLTLISLLLLLLSAAPPLCSFCLEVGGVGDVTAVVFLWTPKVQTRPWLLGSRCGCVCSSTCFDRHFKFAHEGKCQTSWKEQREQHYTPLLYH